MVRLSRLYLLDEIALGIRLRQKYKLYDEFYLGPQLEVLPRILLHPRRDIMRPSRRSRR